MTDTNQNVQDESKNAATPVDATKVAPANENKAVAQDGATTEAKPEEKKAE